MISEIAHKIIELKHQFDIHDFPDSLLKITVSHEVFNTLVCEAFKSPLKNSDGNYLSNFTPSDAHNFRIAGVKVEPFKT